ncbi:sugar phosphate isomerase/epimerase family protein [Paenibacillus humicola]|uniref:sugar phosphate isomerase/epimerase family protein n=1 Tax=Paenibacillus humicola TaxID=3110540 RepID=UPI00237B4293|nr:sugar phosphate isomerase/epimerase family protein [Paenibacillus humicola]
MNPKIVLAGNMYDDAPIERFLQDAASIGYQGVELRGVGELLNVPVPRERGLAMKEMLVRLGLEAANLSLFAGNFACNTAEENEREIRRWEHYLDFAETIGCGMMRLNPGFQHSGEVPEANFAEAVRCFRICADAAAERGVRVAIEMHHGTLCDHAESALAFVRAVGRTNVGLILDPVNLYQVPAEYGADAIKMLKDHLFNVHVKDIVRLTGPDYPWAFEYGDYVPHIGRFHRVVPKREPEAPRYYAHRLINQGGIDWCAVLKGLAEVGYNGCLTVESVAKPGSELPVYGDLARKCMDDLKALLDLIGSVPKAGTA